jgi:hypothetical protein
MIGDLRSEAKQVVKLAYQLSQTTSTRHQLPVTRHDLGEAEVAVLFACYKEYFAPFWVGPLRRSARRGVVIGTIAHDPVRDFVVGPLCWHRWSVSLGYSFVRHVFVHDDTPVDLGGKRPKGIQVHEIPHGPYEVAEKYELGVFVKPDDAEEISRGASKLVPSSTTGKCEFRLKPDWDKYEQENSWEENARRVCQAFKS